MLENFLFPNHVLVLEKISREYIFIVQLFYCSMEHNAIVGRRWIEIRSVHETNQKINSNLAQLSSRRSTQVFGNF